jgi:5-(carboxyamino)imidazole ribonucleotide synthase
MNYFSSDFKLGILGGGQLGFCLTLKFDIQTYVLDPSDEAPAKLPVINSSKRFDGF